jgi:hypothetical protein
MAQKHNLSQKPIMRKPLFLLAPVLLRTHGMVRADIRAELALDNQRNMRHYQGNNERDRTMNYVLSIGLNVGGSEPADQYARTLGAIVCYAPTVTRIAETRGEWDGIPERSLQVLARFETETDAHEAAAGLAGMLQQDAVAVIPATGAPNRKWTLVDRNGAVVGGGSLTDFLIKV